MRWNYLYNTARLLLAFSFLLRQYSFFTVSVVSISLSFFHNSRLKKVDRKVLSAKMERSLCIRFASPSFLEPYCTEESLLQRNNRKANRIENRDRSVLWRGTQAASASHKPISSTIVAFTNRSRLQRSIPRCGVYEYQAARIGCAQCATSVWLLHAKHSTFAAVAIPLQGEDRDMEIDF